MKNYLISTIGLLLFVSPFASAQNGIFDMTADWGGPDSPPQRGTVKVAGSVDVTGTGADAVYTLSGNGDDIWENNDEGFFVYTEKTGSWRLSAKFLWEEPGTSEWSKVGVMMRESGSAADSKHYWVELRGAAFGDRVDAQWRPTTGGASSGSQIFEEDGTTPVQDFGDGLYLRITRYAEIDMVLSEFSYDGTEWFPGHSQTMEFPDTIAWGLTITSHTDDEALVEATVSDIVLEEVQNVVAVTRDLSASTFNPGQAITVTLNLINPSGQPLTTTLTETPPTGFDITNISNGGTLNGGVITWTQPVPSGSSTLTYTATVPANYDPAVSGYSAQWTGTDGTLEFVGENSLFLVNFGAGAQLFDFDFSDPAQYDQWTDLAGVWGVEDGQFYEFDDAGGPLVTLTGDPTLTDVAVSVRAMGLVADGDWGIVFRATDISNFYSWQFVNGNLELLEYVGGTRTTLFTEPYAEALNVWQEFQVVAQGPVIQCYFNGELQAIVEDDSLTEGQVGLFGWVNGGSTAENDRFLAFDDFTVSSVVEATSVSRWSLY